MRLSPLDPDAPISVEDADALSTTVPSEKKLKKKLSKHLRVLTELQARLYADGRYSLLVILQGRDAAGKDGTIRTVFGACNPQGCAVTSFKEPTPVELKHDFLWRIHQAVPPRGMIGIFNRSQYEDVLTVRVHDMVAERVWKQRYDQINDFERMLAQNNVVILKFFLHISREEQRRRLVKRATQPEKNWKMQLGDLDDRAHWDAYSEAYHDVLKRCSTPHAPWYLVPADDKQVRNYFIAGVLVQTLKQLDLSYPDANPDVIQRTEQVLSK